MHDPKCLLTCESEPGARERVATPGVMLSEMLLAVAQETSDGAPLQVRAEKEPS